MKYQLLITLLLLAGCNSPVSNSSFLNDDIKNNYQKAQTLIGKKYWVKSRFAEVCEKPIYSSCKSLSNSITEYYGPFIIKNVERTPNDYSLLFYTETDITAAKWLKVLSLDYLTNVEPKKTIPISSKQKSKPNKKCSGGIHIGMNKDQVLSSCWGRPHSKNITMNIYGTHEQWVYGYTGYVYFDDGIVTSIQTSQ